MKLTIGGYLNTPSQKENIRDSSMVILSVTHRETSLKAKAMVMLSDILIINSRCETGAM
jgi:hypothetical protein